MRVLQALAGTGLLLAVLAFGAGAQNRPVSIGGPVLGFVSGGEDGSVRPILGVPGASMLGDALDLGPGVTGVIVAPGNNYFLARQAEALDLILIPLEAGATGMPLGVDAAADEIALSPAGSAAAVYDRSSGRLQVIRGLPDSPRFSFELQTPFAGRRSPRIAVSDDGEFAVFGASAPFQGLWAGSASGIRGPIAAIASSAVAFVPGSYDVILDDRTSGEVFLLRDALRTAAPIRVLGRGRFRNVSAVGATGDGGRILVADGDSGEVIVAPVAGGGPEVVRCACRPTGFHPLKAGGLFALNRAPNGAGPAPLAVLDVSSDAPRILVIPSER